VNLHVLRVGHAPVSYVFLHGLLGQGKNWATIAKALSPASSLLVDLPDHGRSPWSDEVSYEGMAEAVIDLLRGLDQPSSVTLVGHSMGGKVAMLVALLEPSLVGRLVVVDISPTVRTTDEFVGYVDAMLALDLGDISSRGEADARLTGAAPDDTVRGFLLQSLQRTHTGWAWRPNLVGLRRGLPRVGGWPEVSGTYEGPVLWFRGERSSYVTDADLPEMRALFPRVRLVTIKNAGHWVHADQPSVLAESLAHWVAANT
jgi:pimeloyl-ACP methyl ester carboxylesterase